MSQPTHTRTAQHNSTKRTQHHSECNAIHRLVSCRHTEHQHTAQCSLRPPLAFVRRTAHLAPGRGAGGVPDRQQSLGLITLALSSVLFCSELCGAAIFGVISGSLGGLAMSESMAKAEIRRSSQVRPRSSQSLQQPGATVRTLGGATTLAKRRGAGRCGPLRAFVLGRALTWWQSQGSL